MTNFTSASSSSKATSMSTKHRSTAAAQANFEGDGRTFSTSAAAPAAGAAAAGANGVMGKQIRELKVEDALQYLDQVKTEFGHESRIYNEFLDIMNKFKTHAIDRPGVMDHVSKLFRGNNKLILGFNTFLPDGHKIDLNSIEESNRKADEEAVQGLGWVN